MPIYNSPFEQSLFRNTYTARRVKGRGNANESEPVVLYRRLSIHRFCAESLCGSEVLTRESAGRRERVESRSQSQPIESRYVAKGAVSAAAQSRPIGAQSVQGACSGHNFTVPTDGAARPELHRPTGTDTDIAPRLLQITHYKFQQYHTDASGTGSENEGGLYLS